MAQEELTFPRTCSGPEKFTGCDELIGPDCWILVSGGDEIALERGSEGTDSEGVNGG